MTGLGIDTSARVNAVMVAAIPSMRFADLPRSGLVGWQLSLWSYCNCKQQHNADPEIALL